ncbi:hypothetical protein BFP70_05010 [Thioclava sp. SK-1]|nr:hypothetical protein BFP70_05010 [Thioclava sp. SK-1]
MTKGSDQSASDMAVRVAVVIPIFRHSVLLSEAIDSILDQDAPWGIRIVLVNDGCPHRETDQVCRTYARAYPEQIAYVPKKNGGLSDARNCGIGYALARWQELEAIYLLDADNRLRPPALRRAMTALDEHPDVDWVYPNIDMFGLRYAGDYGGPYSRLIHTVMNVCEAGSLVHRRVFDAGVVFDTSFKSGFEDWDFFLTAGDAGFTGMNLEEFGFQYRKRGESMLADSERDADAIRAEMRKKHKQLFSPKGLLALEQEEAPRFAIHLSDTDQVIWTVDPSSPNRKIYSFDEYSDLLFRSTTGNKRYFVPPLTVVTDSQLWKTLCDGGLVSGVLWALERQLDHACPVTVAHVMPGNPALPQRQDTLTMRVSRDPSAQPVTGGMAMLETQLVRKVLKDSSLSWISQLELPHCPISVARIEMTVPQALWNGAGAAPDRVACDLLALMARLRRNSLTLAAAHTWEWRTQDIGWRERTHKIPRQTCLSSAAYPRVADGGLHIGFLLPLVEFGGVERVALNVARALKRAGFHPHLFVLEQDTITYPAEWRETFDTVTFLADPEFATWGPTQAAYFGTDISDWSRWGNKGNATAMLAWLDGVVNFHGAAISGVMGQLKRLGVVTANSLHLSDHSVFARPVGNTYHALAFEHAYDMILPCSNMLGDWCHAMGMPAEKIIPIPNAPSFDLPATAGAPRTPHVPERALRALYIGRLDMQKGLDRLVPIVEGSQEADFDIKWRYIGGTVLGTGGAALPATITDSLEPPKTTPEAMTEALEWADVIVLPSYFEGLPLIVLEAMRAGAVPLATDVGAVSEAVVDGHNGILLSNAHCVTDAMHALDRLACDRDLLQRLSQQAIQDMQDRTWDGAAQPFIHRLKQLCALQGQSQPVPSTQSGTDP